MGPRAGPASALEAEPLSLEPTEPSKLLRRLANPETTDKNAALVSVDEVAANRGLTVEGLGKLLERGLDRIVVGALRLDPQKRYPTASRLADDLNSYASGSALWIDTHPAAGAKGSTALRHRAGWSIRGRLGAMAAAALLVLAGLYVSTFLSPTPPAELRRFTLLPPADVALTEGPWNVPTVSPSGDRVAFIGSEQNGDVRLWARSFDSETALPVPSGQGAQNPFWSPDGSAMGFFALRQLRVASLDGRRDSQLAPTVGQRGGAWGSRDVILYAPDAGDGLFRVSPQGGAATRVTTPDRARGEIGHWWPQFLPDGERFVFFVASADPSVQGVYASSLSSAGKHRIVASPSSGIVAGEFILYVERGRLLSRPIDLGTLTVHGEPNVVSDSVAVTVNSQGVFSAWSEEVLVLAKGNVKGRTRIAWQDGTGRTTDFATRPGSFRNPDLADDGTKVAVEVHDDGANGVRVLDLRRGTEFDLAEEFANTEMGVLGPAGSDLYFASNVGGRLDIYRKEIGNMDAATLVVASPNDKFPTDVSPDGRYLAYHERNPGTDMDIVIASLDPEEEGPREFRLARSAGIQGSARFSPSGRHIAYLSSGPTRYQIYVQPFPSTGDECQVSIDGGYDPAWGESDDVLFFLDPDGTMMRSTRTSVDGCAFEAPVALFETTVRAPGASRNHYSTRPGQAGFLFNLSTPVGGVDSMDLVFNWGLLRDRS
ncbi:MAG: hypothetical protein GKS06_00225 [Acidobacteria bacterium]|nr:hypothetical protein [Acidobacteriota bacterium]